MPYPATRKDSASLASTKERKKILQVQIQVLAAKRSSFSPNQFPFQSQEEALHWRFYNLNRNNRQTKLFSNLSSCCICIIHFLWPWQLDSCFVQLTVSSWPFHTIPYTLPDVSLVHLASPLSRILSLLPFYCSVLLDIQKLILTFVLPIAQISISNLLNLQIGMLLFFPTGDTTSRMLGRNWSFFPLPQVKTFLDTYLCV